VDSVRFREGAIRRGLGMRNVKEPEHRRRGYSGMPKAKADLEQHGRRPQQSNKGGVKEMQVNSP
jgi:hypothetical protein